MRSIFVSVIGFGGFWGTLTLCAPAFAHGISNTRAAELSLHRLERLVVLKRVDPDFQTKFKELTIARVDIGGGEVNFKTLHYQYPATDTSQKTLEILLDDAGRAISHRETQGGPATGAPQWPDKDAVTLAEAALHFVEENSEAAEIKPYYDSMTKQTLWEEKTTGSQVYAVSDIRIDDTKDVLRIRIKTNGEYLSHEFVKQDSKP